MAKLVWRPRSEASTMNQQFNDSTALQNQEGWGDWLERNIATLPFVSGAKIAGSVSDVGRKLAKDWVEPAPMAESPTIFNLLSKLQEPTPTDAQLQSFDPQQIGYGTEDILKTLPYGLGNVQPGDVLSEYGSEALPFLIGSGATTLPGLLKGGLTALGGILGGRAIAPVGRQIGEAVGYPETGEVLGGLAGTVGGIKGARKAYGYASNIPTKAIPKKLERKRLGQQENITRMRERLPEQIQEHLATAQDNYAKLESLLDKEYNGDIQLEVPNLSKQLTKLADKATKGIPEPQQGQVYKLFQNIVDDIENGKISLDTARATVENLGRTAYEGALSPSVKRAADRARSLLKDTVSAELKNYPDVKQYWENADQNYKSYKGLIKKQGQIEKAISKREKTLTKEILPIQQTADMINKAFEKFAPGVSGYTVANIVSSALNAPGWAKQLISLTGAGVGELGRQLKLIKNTLKKHPDVYKSWRSAVQEAQKGNIGDLVGIIPIVDDLVTQKKSKPTTLVWRPKA